MAWASLAAFSCTLACLVVALRSARLRAALSDHPNHRSLHSRATPRFGGLGVLMGFTAGIGISASIDGLRGPSWPCALWIAYLALALGSAIDDRRSLPAALRMLLHVCVAAVWTTVSGLPGLWAAIVTIGMVWAMNLYNFMDGADGLAGGMAVIGFGAYAIAASMAPGLASGQELSSPLTTTPVAGGEIVLVASILATAALAFLSLNFPPARLFMGDAGSIPLGFAAAAVGLHGWQRELWSPLFPLIVFFPFAFDATLTLLRRLARGERFWQPHREHLYQRAILSGLTHRSMTLRAYCFMMLCACVALIGRNFTIWIETLIIAAQLAVGLALAARIARIDAQERDRS